MYLIIIPIIIFCIINIWYILENVIHEVKAKLYCLKNSVINAYLKVKVLPLTCQLFKFFCYCTFSRTAHDQRIWFPVYSL